MEKSNLREMSNYRAKDLEIVRRPLPAIEKLHFDAPPSEETIAKRAYELFQRRGRQDGFDRQDWLSAERELMLRSSLLKVLAHASC
jgi:hypothetical protein